MNINAHDFATPERNPKEADYTTPLYTPQNRNPLLNTDAVVSYWYSNYIISKQRLDNNNLYFRHLSNNNQFSDTNKSKQIQVTQKSTNYY